MAAEMADKEAYRPHKADMKEVKQDRVTGAVNVGDLERLVSMLGGTSLVLLGLTRRSPRGALMGALGAGLVYRGVTGYCPLYQSLEESTDQIGRRKVGTRGGVKVETSIVVNRPAEDLFRFWRNFENLPHIMRHVESVTKMSETRSHWVIRIPNGASGTGLKIDWDAEMINEKEPELIGWRTLQGALVDHAGSVRFLPGPREGSTEVRVMLQYHPPGGLVGAAFAKLFGHDPEAVIREDLHHFKQIMEEPEPMAGHS